MWTLECDGDSLANKKIWLRPGKKYLFGRTKQPAGRDAGYRIDHKSISRQHLTISVSNVRPGDGAVVSSRSEIILKDEDTKFKTEIDGNKIKNESRALTKDEHVFRLGNLGHVFRIKWYPVVFTFSLNSKEMKQGNDPLNGYRIRLEDLDVKVSMTYVTGHTTHVVAGKRNTAKGLQALINAKHIVSETFIDALVYAATPSNLDEAESLSPLEEDFEGNWPDARQHLPAKSKEPSERPKDDFAPNEQRSSVFEGYTFIFCDIAQFDALQAPITNGGGKALHCMLIPGETTATEIVRYVKNANGENGLKELEDGSEGEGVVVIKFRGSKGYEDWAAGLDREVAQALDLRLIEQSEFLDAILANDASVLRKPLLPADRDSVPAVATNIADVEAEEEAQIKVPDTPVKRARPRGKIVSRFKGFDDDDDDTSMPSYSQTGPASYQPTSIPSNVRPQRYPNGASLVNEDFMDIDSQARSNGHEATDKSRKRPAPSSDVEDDEDVVDKLLPTATAMKRRRMEDEANGVSVYDSPKAVSQAQAKPAKKPAKLRNEVNIKDFVRERREAEDAEAREDEETLRDILDGMTVEEMKSLAVVEEMDVSARRASTRRANGEDNPLWDERWNGRKNFKRFRRRGDGSAAARRGTSVIVPLEEVKRKDFGIGEAYWQEPNEKAKSQKRKEKSKSESHSQSQQQRDTLYTTARSQPHTAGVPAELLVGIGDSSELEVVDVDAPRATRGSERTQLTDKSTNRFQTVPQSQPGINGKRSASGGQMVPPAVKKRKRFAAAKDSDSDD